MAEIRCAQFGLGPIGIESLRLAAERPGLVVLGGIDIDPAKVGRPLSEVAGLDGPAGETRVYSSFEELVADQGPVDVVLHTAGSNAAVTLEQIEPMVAAGVSVATTCEAMIFPALTAKAEAERIDELCGASGARVVGTGVNPGFVLDFLPVFLTGVSRRVDRVYGERVVNASTRRMQLQRKVGSGMAPETFRELFRLGKAGHAGFRESAALIAHCLGWPTDDIRETCEPIVAEGPIQTEYFTVERGQTCGLHQIVKVYDDGIDRVELDLKMYLDAPQPIDRVVITGDPPLELQSPTGIAGDHATVAALVNAVPRLLAAKPGVRLLPELGCVAPQPVSAKPEPVAAVV
ncbi:MAG: dihydrodipicolinate reductase [Planctomycetota bacterium]